MIPDAPPQLAVSCCPLCGQEKSTTYSSGPDRLFGVPGVYRHERCGECGTVFQSPRVLSDHLSSCYPPEYYTHTSDGAVHTPVAKKPDSFRSRVRDAVVDVLGQNQVRGLVGLLARLLARMRFFRERASFRLSKDYFVTLDEVIPRSPHPGRALDVGCGSGRQLGGLARMGWAAEGVEWDPAAAGAARRNSGVVVHAGDFRTVDLPTSAFDLVFLHHVLEHLESPHSVLRRAWELLRPGGRLVLVYPNPVSLGAKAFGRDWFHWDPPRHLVLVPPGALAGAAKDLGFQVASLRTTSRLASGANAASRALRCGDEPVLSANPGLRDQILALLEGACSLFWYAGQEVVLSLRRPQRANDVQVGETRRRSVGQATEGPMTGQRGN